MCVVVSGDTRSDFLKIKKAFTGVKKMPLTAKGKKILASMIKEYGEEKGKEVFYSMENSGKLEGVSEAKKKAKKKGW